MKNAKNFRKSAREALRGKWKLGVAAGLVTSMIIGVNESTSVSIAVSSGTTTTDSTTTVVDSANAAIPGLTNEFIAQWLPVVIGFMAIFAIIGILTMVVMAAVASVVGVGYSKFNLELVDGTRPDFGTIFGYFKQWKSAFVMEILRTIYIALWTILFIIPGYIASLSYSMAPYILAENPEFTASQAITESKKMMKGNKWRLFCLSLSFIGWDILCVLSFGIGYLWLAPYKKAAIADFYREISGTRPTPCECAEAAEAIA